MGAVDYLGNVPSRSRDTPSTDGDDDDNVTGKCKTSSQNWHHWHRESTKCDFVIVRLGERARPFMSIGVIVKTVIEIYSYLQDECECSERWLTIHQTGRMDNFYVSEFSSIIFWFLKSPKSMHFRVSCDSHSNPDE